MIMMKSLFLKMISSGPHRIQLVKIHKKHFQWMPVKENSILPATNHKIVNFKRIYLN